MINSSGIFPVAWTTFFSPMLTHQWTGGRNNGCRNNDATPISSLRLFFHDDCDFPSGLRSFCRISEVGSRFDGISADISARLIKFIEGTMT